MTTSTFPWQGILGFSTTRIVPLALDPEDPASPVNTSSADSVLALYFVISKVRASITDIASAAPVAVLVVQFELDQEDTAPPGDIASADSVVALSFANPGNRVPPAEFATAAAAVFCRATSSGPKIQLQ